VKYWEAIADNLKKPGWSLGYVSAIDSNGRTIWIVDAHRNDGKQNDSRRPLPRRLKTAADPRGSALQRSFLSAKAATGECLARNKDGDMNHNKIRGAKKAYK